MCITVRQNIKKGSKSVHGIFQKESPGQHYFMPKELVGEFYINLPNRLWGLLGPQRTKIVHIFVITVLSGMTSRLMLGSKKTPGPV